MSFLHLSLVVVALVSGSWAQQDAVPRRDAEAVKIEAHDAAIYRPASAGLAALEFEFPMPEAALPGLVLDIAWKAPDSVTVTAKVADSAPRPRRSRCDCSRT
jgi:hypothetical protein